MPEPSHIAGVMPISSGSCSAMSQSQLPKISWYLGSGALGLPVAGEGSILLMA